MVTSKLVEQDNEKSGKLSRHLPAYASEMADFHAAFELDLRWLLGQVPLSNEGRVLDVACGDGFYSRLLAERLSQEGCVIGLDTNRPYLELASKQASVGGRVTFVQASLKEFTTDHGFDLVWCAQSLYSLPDPSSALRQMVRLVRPGGVLAVLENDTLHQLLLPWPASVELAIRTAEYEALIREAPHAEKYYVARQLKALLAESGLESGGNLTQCLDRQRPLSPCLEGFLKANLRRLKERVVPSLKPDMRREVEALISVDSPQFLLTQPHFTMTWINHLVWGRKPENGHRS